MTDWRKQAACKGLAVLMDPPDPTTADLAAALAVCWDCPVQGDCLAWALTLSPDPGGVLGGTTEAGRAAWRRVADALPAPPPRIDQRNAIAAERRSRFARMRAAGVPVHEAARELGISRRHADRYEARRKALKETA